MNRLKQVFFTPRWTLAGVIASYVATGLVLLFLGYHR